MFSKHGLYFFVRRNLTAGYGRKRLIDRLNFLGRCVIDTVPSRLDFQGNLRKLVLIVLGPMRDPRQHVFHIRIHGPYLALYRFLCTLCGSVILAAGYESSLTTSSEALPDR